MQRKHLQFGAGFKVAIGNSRSQAATMVLEPGEREGGPDNCHVGADQWLYVVSGRGVARIAGKRVELKTGSVVLIERGEMHEIHNAGRTKLITLNIYVPPAYTSSGDERPAGRSLKNS